MRNDAVSDAVLGCLLQPALAGLAAQLGHVTGLSEAERGVVLSAARAAALETVRIKTNRVLLVELNAARITGRLAGQDPRARWREWEEQAATRAYWESLAEYYPTMLPRLERLVAARCAAALSLATRFAADHEETLYVPEQEGWRDLRTPDRTAAAWCHGAAGIGIAAADLIGGPPGGGSPAVSGSVGLPQHAGDALRRAAKACRLGGLGWNHTLCHGDLGVWEVLDQALALGLAEPDLDRRGLDAHALCSMEEYGPVSGFARDAYAPGLLPGLGGVAYQLLRLHPDCTLPSVLLPDPGPASRP